MRRVRWIFIAPALLALLAGGGCRARPAAVDAGAARGDAGTALPESFTFTDATPELLLSVLDPQGRPVNVERPADVPEALRARVMVVDLSRTPEQRQADRFVYFADLSAADLQGRYTARPMSRYRGQPRPAGQPGLAPVPAGAVVIYTTPWCGFCKKAKAYLRERGVDFVERDVEGSASAARELEGKLRSAGAAGGGVPVLDIGGELVMGFDRERIDSLLATREAGPDAG